MNRIRRHMSATLSDGRDGAALVTAIFVVTILFAVVITATIMTRQEGRIARNVADTVRAKMLAEGGVNIAMAALNADLHTNRAVTSIATIMQIYYPYGDWKSEVYDLILDGREQDIMDHMWIPAYGWDDRDRNGLVWKDLNGNGLWDPGWPEDLNGNGLWDRGEPNEIDMLVGRYVFAIVDESSKININVAGNPGDDPFSNTYRHRSNEGVSPAEIDMGVLPGLDSDADGLANKFVYFRFGAEGGGSIAFPGAANVDDDRDNLFISTDGIDNDGDGIIDEALYTDRNEVVPYYTMANLRTLASAWAAYQVYQPLEGFDEPDEFRQLRSIADDRPLKTIEQSVMVDQIGAARFNNIRDFITVDSADRDVIYSLRDDYVYVPKEGLRVNLNLADVRQIAHAAMAYKPVNFGDASKAFQIAANIADFRDQDCARTEVIDPVTENVYAGIEAIRINEIMVRPTRRVEAEGYPGFEVSAEGYPDENVWQLEGSGYIGRSSYFREDRDYIDVNNNGYYNEATDERPTLTLRIGLSELVPPGRYYVILDFSIPSPMVMTDPTGTIVHVSPVGLEYRVAASGGYYTNWQRQVPDERGRVVVDVDFKDTTDDAIDPVFLSYLWPSLEVQVRRIIDEDQNGTPAYFNAVILSQEPDMEWVELFNAGTKRVNLSGWELEVADNQWIGTIPYGTYIESGEHLVLAVDASDEGPGTIYYNDMSLTGGVGYPGVVQLINWPGPTDATPEMILGGGRLPNDPGNDGVDSDGDTGWDNPPSVLPVTPYLYEARVGEMQMVKLYEGSAGDGRLVDCVTYSWQDVQDADGNLEFNEADRDFYHSLERISPYYTYYTGEVTGDRPRVRAGADRNELVDFSAGGYLDGNYDNWASDWTTSGTLRRANAATAAYSLVPLVKNTNFATVGELLDVPWFNPDNFFRPTRMSIEDVAAMLDLTTTSRMDLTVAQSEVVDPGSSEWSPGPLFDDFETDAELAEAVWQWDIDDGLEDGVYDLHLFIGEIALGHPDTRPVTIEVFSDPDDADDNGEVAFPVEWRSFGLLESVVARPDGIISYGTVNVRGNVLRVRLVNRAQNTVTNSFTRIALAPRQRDYGKINVNTVMNSDELGGSNVLSALPGLLQEWNGTRLEPSSDSSNTGIRDMARARAAAIVELRESLPYRAYLSTGDLLETLAELPSQWTAALDTTILLDTAGWSPYAVALVQFNETLERFKHISNLITERSDVFEIICVAQAGQKFGDEFVPVAEKKIRVVYER